LTSEPATPRRGAEGQEPNASIVGVFDSAAQAQRALDQLRAIGLSGDEISVMARDQGSRMPSGIRPQMNRPELGLGDRQEPTSQEGSGSGDEADSESSQNVAGGAATGAVFGGLLGAVAGWMVSAGALAIPGVGIVVGASVLTTTVAGAALGTAIGGLIGALISVGLPQRDADKYEEHLREGRILLTVRPHMAESIRSDTHIEEILQASGAYDVRVYGEPELRKPEYGVPSGAGEAQEPSATEPESGSKPRTDAGWMTPVGTTFNTNPTAHADADKEKQVDNDERGRDPNTFTGTEDAIDPATGTYGTAGTPVTTGYGVSGSTVGVGSSAGEEEHLEREFSGATPDSASYETGGRASTDDLGEGSRPELGAAQEPTDSTVVDRYADAKAYDTASPQAPDEQDIYDQGPGYGSETVSGFPEQATPATPSTPSGQGPAPQVDDVAAVEASQGTDIPGTADPRGLGDNTDDTSDED
jgi:hypothetical protein